METYLSLTKEHWWRMYGITGVVDPSFMLKLRPLSDIKSMEVIQVCAYAAPLSFTTHEDRSLKKWTTEVDKFGTWSCSCPLSGHHFQIFCDQEQTGGFSIISYDEDEKKSLLIEDQSIITEWGTAVAYLISINIDVFNINRFGFVKLYTTPDPISVEPIKSSPWTRKKK